MDFKLDNASTMLNMVHDKTEGESGSIKFLFFIFISMSTPTISTFFFKTFSFKDSRSSFVIISLN